ncbi:hypothetical protein Salat_2557700 [Sesamum alatum]|uniref:Increased DNA methylation 1 C-terminal domain-containing protein n=1 Tax=Sesamum alatum TaxID=300844 RepID=A0AAE2CCR3_9LAMI|nr:hypothetical protein Salat_2557700 [Sesamum alatum]
MVDLGFQINRAGAAEVEFRANDTGPSELNDAEWVAGSLRRVRAREANGFVVYTRNKRFKRRSEGVSITEASSNSEGEFEMKEDEVAKIDGASRVSGSGGMECVKLAASGSRKMCKEILIAGRQTTPAELLQTGLLEGYSVFYNGVEGLLYSALQKLLNVGVEKLPDSCLDILKKRISGNNSVANAGFDVKWRLLKGNESPKQDRALLSQAVAIFHVRNVLSFELITKNWAQFDPPMVYGRKVRGEDFGGLYCAILMVNSIVVSAGIIWIFGQDTAELQLAATRTRNQGNLVLPVADSAKPMWTNKFGFEEIAEAQLEYYRQTCWQMITFNGTSVLHKPVPKCGIVNQEQADSDVSLQCD